MFKIYYLLYKLHNDSNLWIIKNYDNRKLALKDFKYFKKHNSEKEGNYFLIKKTLEENEINFDYMENELIYKQFRIFNITNNDSYVYDI